ncbi:TIGR03619 family F420-dependent LLM class oxidoreductase [Rhodococcus sp. NPDC003322]
MRIGIVSPVVTRVPGAHSAWEADVGIAELALIAEHADALGFAHLTCSEHVAVPVAVAQQRGGTYWDPLATFGYLAARTDRIRFVTQVLVLGYHHPLEIAKRYGTLDTVSDGRLTLGLGVGSLAEEFEVLDVPFDGRGERADDAMRALRQALSVEVPEYRGPHYEFGGMQVDPRAVQEHLPLWVGGRSKRSLRRAVELGDGWVPFGLSNAAVRSMLGGVDLPDHFDTVLSAGTVDPVGRRDEAERAVAEAVAAGATTVNVTVAAGSHHEYCDQLSALADMFNLETRSR